MYSIGEQFFHNILRSDIRPCQNNLEVHEDLFLFTYAKILLYKYLRIEGILSLYANPFYPATETKQDTTEIEVQKERKTKKVDKAEIASKLQVNVNNI